MKKSESSVSSFPIRALALAEDVWRHVFLFWIACPRDLRTACGVCARWNCVARGVPTETWMWHFYHNPANYHLRCDENPVILPTLVAPCPAQATLRLGYAEEEEMHAFLASLHSRATLRLSFAGLYARAYTFRALLFFDDSSRTYRFCTEDGNGSLLLCCGQARMEMTLHPDWLAPLLFA